MRTEEPRAIHLADYRAPEFRIPTVRLDFGLEPEATRVTARLAIERQGGNGPLVLQGENQKLLSVALDGRALPTLQRLGDGRPGNAMQGCQNARHAALLSHRERGCGPV